MYYRLISILVGGVLIAVFWYDLMFDVQVIPYLDVPDQTPQGVIDSIRFYYARVTLDAEMVPFVGSFMVLGILTGIMRLWRSRESLALRLFSLSFVTIPTVWALVFIVPMSRKLARLDGPTSEQVDLLFSIYWSHLACVALTICFIMVQLFGGAEPKTEENSL